MSYLLKSLFQRTIISLCFPFHILIFLERISFHCNVLLLELQFRRYFFCQINKGLDSIKTISRATNTLSIWILAVSRKLLTFRKYFSVVSLSLFFRFVKEVTGITNFRQHFNLKVQIFFLFFENIFENCSAVNKLWFFFQFF